MANEIKLKIKVDDDGNLKIVGKNAEKAAKGLDQTGRAAQTADRRLKGAAQASSNSTKNFSKLAQGISGGLVPAYATLAAQIFAISAAFQFLRSSSEISNLIAGQEALAATTGVAYKTITNSIKEATDGQLQYAEAAKAAAIGTASGLSPDQLNRLAGAAKVASVALGRDLTDSFNRLIRGVTKAEPELLDELGIILRLESATQKYADSVGKARNDLTAFERSQAVANEVLGQAEAKFGKLERIIDPNVFALNKFTASFDTLLNTVKSGVIESLRPLFLFLSDNTLALVSALSLVALPIVKSILPSFKEWGESAGDSLKLQERRLKVYQYKLEKARKTVENFKKTQEEQKRDLSKGAERILGPTPKSKSGGSAADFLLGRSENSKAQKNAQKVLDNAEAQVKKSGAVITGYLKGKNAEQVADLRRSYKARIALLKGFEQQHKSTWAKASAQVRVYSIQATAALSKVKKAAITTGAGIARGLGALSAAAGWIGILTLVGTAVFELYRKFFPIPEEVKKTKEAFDNFEKSTKTLNEELQRTFKTLEEPGLLTVRESVESLGNVLNSADLVNKFNELSELDKTLDPKGFEVANEAFQALLNTTAKVSPEFKKLADEYSKSNTFSKEQLATISMLNEKYIGASQASQRWAESQENLNRALVAVRGSIKVSGYDQLLSIVRANIQENEKFNNTAIPLALEREAASKKELKAAIAAQDGTQKSRDTVLALARAYEDSVEEIKKLGKENKYLVTLEAEFKDISDKVVANEDKILANAKQISKEKSLGITFEQKISNIQLKRLSRENKEKAIETKLLIAQAEQRAAGEGKDEDEKASAKRRVDQLLAELEVQQNSNVLAEKRDNISIRAINLEETILGIKKEQFTVDQKIVSLNQRKLASKAGLTGSFGLERASEQAALQAKSLKDRISSARLALKAAEAAEDQLNNNKTDFTPEQTNRIKNDVVTSQNRVNALKQEAYAFAARGVEIVNSVKAENELLFIKQRTLSISSVENSIQAALLMAKREGIELTNSQIAVLSRQIERQEELNLLIESQEGLYRTLETGFENAFSGIIQGTTSVKDAFANLAKSVLQYLAQMIAKMLVFKLIQLGVSAFGFGSSPTNIASGSGSANVTNPATRTTINPFFRMGGVAENVPGYSSGGIARGRQAGYPAVLHGTEAVVPLPNGKSIPVEMGKGMGQSNNVVVNVNVDSNGNSQQNSQGDQGGLNLGTAIATAVQKELQNQKRSGGILNPYGAA
jgi:hypothetical protein